MAGGLVSYTGVQLPARRIWPAAGSDSSARSLACGHASTSLTSTARETVGVTIHRALVFILLFLLPALLNARIVIRAQPRGDLQ